MMDIKEDQLEWFTSYLIKKSAGSGIKSMSNQQLTDELQNQLLENFKKEEFIIHLKLIFEVLIQLICN